MQEGEHNLLSAADIPRVTVWFQKQVYASASHVLVGSFLEAADLICLNELLNPPEIYAQKTILDHKILWK